MKCPFCCSQGGVRPVCYPSECAMSDGNGDCLIRQALQCYVKSTKEKTEFTRSYIGQPYPPKEEVKLRPPRVETGYVP